MTREPETEAIKTAERAGRSAFWRGMRYQDNPFGPLRPKQRLAWSNGFNWAHAQKIAMTEDSRRRHPSKIT